MSQILIDAKRKSLKDKINDSKVEVEIVTEQEVEKIKKINKVNKK